MRTSYSALNTFGQCKQKFKFQIIDKIKAPKSVEAVFGTTVHGTLKFMFSHDPLFPTLDEIVNNFVEGWKASSNNIFPVMTQEHQATYEESGKAIIKNFYKKNLPWLFHVVDTESRFEVLIQDPKTNNSHILTGVIDRIDKIGEVEYEIVDYKTARKLPAQSTVDEDLQLSVYHMALLNRWQNLDAKNIKLSLYFLKHNEKLTTVRTTETLAKTLENILKTIRDIEARVESNNFPPSPSGLCDYCPYKTQCSAWRHLYKKDAPTIDEEQLQKTLQEYFLIKENDTKHAKRLKELQVIVDSYMNAHSVDRVFDNNGYFIARRLQQRFKYDFDKIREIMLSAGLQKEWYSILEADEKKLKAILNQLPPNIRDQISEQKKLSKEFTTLVASSKPVKNKKPLPIRLSTR
ncbi:MAG: PD-(D/E)XK nuclease family protein [Patescibacteria group bacterium]